MHKAKSQITHYHFDIYLYDYFLIMQTFLVDVTSWSSSHTKLTPPSYSSSGCVLGLKLAHYNCFLYLRRVSLRCMLSRDRTLTEWRVTRVTRGLWRVWRIAPSREARHHSVTLGSLHITQHIQFQNISMLSISTDCKFLIHFAAQQ